MPPVRRSTAEGRHLKSINLMMQGLLRVNVRILRTLHRAHGLPQPMAPCRPLSPCPVAARAGRGVGNRSRSPRRSRSRDLELNEIGSHAGSHTSSPVPTPHRSSGELALVPCRRATVKKPSRWIEAQNVAKLSLELEGVSPRGKVRRRAQEVMAQWALEKKQGEAQRKKHEQSLRSSAGSGSD